MKLCPFVLGLVILTTATSRAQVLPGLAGGQVPKGAERDLKPWLNLGDYYRTDPADTIPGKWLGFEVDNSVPVASVTFTADGTHDWSHFYGLRFEILVEKGIEFEGTVELMTPLQEAKSSYRTTAPVTTTARLAFIGTGKRQTIDLPFSAFDHWYPYGETFHRIKGMTVSGTLPSGQPRAFVLPRVRLIA